MRGSSRAFQGAVLENKALVGFVFVVCDPQSEHSSPWGVMRKQVETAHAQTVGTACCQLIAALNENIP
jgi:hypothetical protein